MQQPRIQPGAFGATPDEEQRLAEAARGDLRSDRVRRALGGIGGILVRFRNGYAFTLAKLQGVDPVEAQPRQTYFFDTPDLILNRAGVVVRARRIRGGDALGLLVGRDAEGRQLLVPPQHRGKDEVVGRYGLTIVPARVLPDAPGGLHPAVRENHPAARFEAVDLERLREGIDEPEVSDALARVDRHFPAAIDATGRVHATRRLRWPPASPPRA